MKDWGDVFDEPNVLCLFERVHQIGSGVVAIGGGFAIKQVDEGAGEADECKSVCIRKICVIRVPFI
ncbi:MAG: hypothetical protein EPN24_07260 [Candidatus Methanoperedens sp.]|nr:MAG: hypothetical protein EPN24_07260 [Candidatus Methanoperedens sp.]